MGPSRNLGRLGQSSVAHHTGPLLKSSRCDQRVPGTTRPRQLQRHIDPHDASPVPIVFKHHDIMAFNFDVQETKDRALDLWNSVPPAAQWTLAGIGALYVARGALSFLQLFLNCFILSGTNVRPCASFRMLRHR